jgi:3',5'-cyclic AMP phosphodiesterase CpdA
MFILAAIGLLFSACSAAAPVPAYVSAIANERPFPFVGIVLGDTRDKLWLEFWRDDAGAERKVLAKRVVEEQPDFIVNTGDIVHRGSSESAWEQFDEENSGVREHKIPYFPCLGNHEYWGDNDAALNNYFLRFPDILGQKWYSFACRNTLFIVLNSCYDELLQYEIAAQEKWLTQKLTAAQADASINFVVVVTHHPPYTNALVHGDATWLQERILPLLKLCRKVRLFVSGHNHSYEHFLVDNIHYIVTGGGGAPLFDVETEPQRQRHKDMFVASSAERRFHYCKLTFYPGYADFAMYMLDTGGKWSEKDRFRLDFIAAR